MNALELVGTVFWALLVLALGSMAIANGDGWAWALFLGCFGMWILLMALVFGSRRDTARG